jgi:hypothetical protein
MSGGGVVLQAVHSGGLAADLAPQPLLLLPQLPQQVLKAVVHSDLLLLMLLLLLGGGGQGVCVRQRGTVGAPRGGI